jgi:hypothetical protein
MAALIDFGPQCWSCFPFVFKALWASVKMVRFESSGLCQWRRGALQSNLHHHWHRSIPPLARTIGPDCRYPFSRHEFVFAYFFLFSGYYCPNGSANPITCPPGTYSLPDCASLSCCLLCAAGSWGGGGGTSSTCDGACAPGYYCSAGSAASTGGGMYLHSKFSASLPTAPAWPTRAFSDWSAPLLGSVPGNYARLQWSSYDARAGGVRFFNSLSIGAVYTSAPATFSWTSAQVSEAAVYINGTLAASGASTLSGSVSLQAGFTPITVAMRNDGSASGYLDFAFRLSSSAAFEVDGFGVLYGVGAGLCPAGVYCAGGSSSADGDGVCSGGRYCLAGSTSAAGSGQCAIGFFCPPGSSTPQGMAVAGSVSTAAGRHFSPGTADGLPVYYGPVPSNPWTGTLQPDLDTRLTANGNAFTASVAQLYNPNGLVVDWSSGRAITYVCDASSYVIRAIDSAGNGSVYDLAGNKGSSDWVDGIGTVARFKGPYGIALDLSSGAPILFVSDSIGHRIRQVTVSNRSVITLAGSGAVSAVNGIGLSASFNFPCGLAIDYSTGGIVLYVGDKSSYQIRKVVVDGSQSIVTTVAGTGVSGSLDGPGSSATFNAPSDVVFGPAGSAFATTLYIIATGSNNIRSLDIVSFFVATLAGSPAGTAGYANGLGQSALFHTPMAITCTSILSHAYLFVTDWVNSRIRQIHISTSTVTTLAGSGTIGLMNGDLSLAQFSNPYGITTHSVDALTGTFRLFVSDTGTQSIRAVAASLPTFCFPGYFCTGGASTGNASNQLCPAGSYCLGLSNGTTTCPPGTYSLPGCASLSCCLLCAAGSWGGGGGTSSTCDGTCLPGYYCPPGSPTSTGGGMYLFTQFYYWTSATASLDSGATGWSSPLGMPGNFNPLAWVSYDARADGEALFHSFSRGHIYTPRAASIVFRTTSVGSSNAPAGIVLNGASIASSVIHPARLFSTVTLQPGFTPIEIRWRTNIKSLNWFQVEFSIDGAPFTSDTLGVLYGPLSLVCPAGVYCAAGASSVLGSGKCRAGFYCMAGSTSVQGNGTCPQSGGYFCPPGSVSPTGLPSSTIVGTLLGDRQRLSGNHNGLGYYMAEPPTSLYPASVYFTMTVANVSAQLAVLAGLPSACVDRNYPQPRVYLPDQSNKLRVWDSATNQVTSIAGGGSAIDGIGTHVQFYFGGSVYMVIDDRIPGDSVLYIAESSAHRIRKVVIATQNVTVVAGVSSHGFVDDVVGTNAKFFFPSALVLDKRTSPASLLVADWDNNRIRKIVLSESAVVTTIAGTGAAGFTSGPALSAQLNRPCGLSLGPATLNESHLLYIAEYAAPVRFSKLDLNTMILFPIVTGSGTFGNVDGIGSNAQFYSPISLLAVDVLGKTILFFVEDYNRVRSHDVATGMTSTLAGPPGGVPALDYISGIGAVATFYGLKSVSILSHDPVTGAHRFLMADSANYVVRTMDYVPISNRTCLAGACCTYRHLQLVYQFFNFRSLAWCVLVSICLQAIIARLPVNSRVQSVRYRAAFVFGPF